MKLVRNGLWNEIEVKRFYIPYSLLWNCENCKKENEFEHDYFSYPDSNKVFEEEYEMECEYCFHNNLLKPKYRINIDLELVEE